MSFKQLLNATCKIERTDYDEDDTNEFNEPTNDPTIIEDDIPCRLEKLYDRELVEAYGGGDHDKGIYVLYTNIGINIRASDLVTIYETVKVSGFSDTNVNGTYKRTYDTVVNDKPVYVMSSTYRIYFDGTNWIIENTVTTTDLFRTSGSNLDDKSWIVVNGTGTTGKSRSNLIPDFHYNTDNNPTQLIVNDVEDAGGGQNHHIQSFCRYRKEIY